MLEEKREYGFLFLTYSIVGEPEKAVPYRVVDLAIGTRSVCVGFLDSHNSYLTI